MEKEVSLLLWLLLWKIGESMAKSLNRSELVKWVMVNEANRWEGLIIGLFDRCPLVSQCHFCLMSLMVAGGWVWVILGLCWVCSSTEKTVASWVWVILLKDGCGCGSTDFVEGWLVGCGCGSMEKTSLWVCAREEREGNNKNVKRMNILLNKCVE